MSCWSEFRDNELYKEDSAWSAFWEKSKAGALDKGVVREAFNAGNQEGMERAAVIVEGQEKTKYGYVGVTGLRLARAIRQEIEK